MRKIVPYVVMAAVALPIAIVSVALWSRQLQIANAEFIARAKEVPKYAVDGVHTPPEIVTATIVISPKRD